MTSAGSGIGRPAGNPAAAADPDPRACEPAARAGAHARHGRTPGVLRPVTRPRIRSSIRSHRTPLPFGLAGSPLKHKPSPKARVLTMHQPVRPGVSTSEHSSIQKRWHVAKMFPFERFILEFRNSDVCGQMTTKNLDRKISKMGNHQLQNIPALNSRWRSSKRFICCTAEGCEKHVENEFCINKRKIIVHLTWL